MRDVSSWDEKHKHWYLWVMDRDQDSLLGCVGLGHRDDDISLFLSCVDIPVGFGSLF